MAKILVGLSGGVDSAVSALLLREAWHDVSAGFMINYLTDDDSCPTRIDMAVAKEVAEFLQIPFFTFDFVEEYERRIVDYIYREYAAGRTPNPDVFCNNLVKFDLFLGEAISYWFDAIATGHYARKGESSELLKWIDSLKDQSYFLSRLNPAQLQKALFPIGHLQKSEVRDIAQKAWLPNALRKDSQGLCFIGKIPMQEFLARKIEKKEGNIVDTSWKIIGTHSGVWNYTIGQRKGIGVGGWPARFVVAKDIATNTLTVGVVDEESMFYTTIRATEWQPLSDTTPVFRAAAKIRYRQPDQACEVRVLPNGHIECFFDTPQRAPSAGQILVIYDWDRVVGSGVIV